jgi:predicted DNA-binding protein
MQFKILKRSSIMANLKVEDKKVNKTVRLRKSFTERLKKVAKNNNMKQIEIIEKGIEMYLQQLEAN